MVERLPLYISESLRDLRSLIKDENIAALTRIERLPMVAHRMYMELMMNQSDQERSYIIAVRYLKVMERLLRLTGDTKRIELCYGNEYRKVKSMIVDLEADLEARYEDLAHRKATQKRIQEAGQPGLYSRELFIRKFPILNNLFILSTDMYNAIRNRWNVLVVDIRNGTDFEDSRIMIGSKHMINVPEHLLVPGLSANTLEESLDQRRASIWNKRDTYEIIILVDWNTDHFNFQGSKLERLRNYMVEWDLNRNYKHDPVILDGGFKEFLERYPSEVTNAFVFLSKTNSEVDELLKLDEITYPEIGSNPDMSDLDITNILLEEDLGFIDEYESEYTSTECGSDEEDPYYDRALKPLELPGDGFTGIANRNNNCYMSCILQCLKGLPPFKDVFVTSNQYYRLPNESSIPQFMEFGQVLRDLWGGSLDNPKVYYPEKLFERVYDLNPLYRRGGHEDAFEFFIFLFNMISDDCSYDIARRKTMTEREKSLYIQLQGRASPFVDWFYFQLRNDKVCWHCRKRNINFDSDNTIMLALSEDRQRQSLEGLLEEYMEETLLSDCSCSECKYSNTIVNRKKIALEPEILVIVLKRYAACSDGTFRKIDTEVTFPDVDLKFGESSYRLYAVAQHSGSLAVGHYYAAVRLKEDIWVKFNDEEVTPYHCPIQEAPSIGCSCVGFFYARHPDGYMFVD